MIKTTTLAILATLISMPAYASIISAYDTTNGASISAGVTGEGVTADDLVRGSGLRQVGNDRHFRSRRWTVGGDAAAALANNDYLEWGFSSTLEYELDTLSFRYDANNNGPKAIAVLASFDGGAFSQIFTDTTVSSTAETANIDLSGIDASSATFRLVGWDATNGRGRFWLRNNGVGDGNDFGISLSGDVAVVPVPAALPLLVGALGMFGFIRRKA